MRTKIVYKILSLSLFSTVVATADPVTDLVNKAIPTSFFSKNKCVVDWGKIAQAEKIDQRSTAQQVSQKLNPCYDKKYQDTLKSTCDVAKGSSNQISVCNRLGITLPVSNNADVVQPVKSGNLSEKEVARKLEKAVPTSTIKCSSGNGNVNWFTIKEIEDNAANKDTANGQIGAYLDDRVKGCLNYNKNKNYVEKLESTCAQGVGSRNQLKVCKDVQAATGRTNLVASEKDSHTLENSLQDLSKQAQAQLDAVNVEKAELQTAHDDLKSVHEALKTQSEADAQKIADLEAQVAAAKTQSEADAQKIADLEAQVAAAKTQSEADAQKIADLEAQLKNDRKEFESYQSSVEQWQEVVLKNVNDWKNQMMGHLASQQADESSIPQSVDDSSSVDPAATNG